MEKVENFYTEYEDMFEEYIEDIKRYLRNNNEEYIKLQKEFHETLDKNENLVFVLEGEITNRNLSNDECFALSKLVKIYYDMQSIEEKEIFFLGSKEAYFFFKKIGILKEKYKNVAGVTKVFCVLASTELLLPPQF